MNRSARAFRDHTKAEAATVKAVYAAKAAAKPTTEAEVIKAKVKAALDKKRAPKMARAKNMVKAKTKQQRNNKEKIGDMKAALKDHKDGTF
jgi:hypothetical protein